MRLQQHSWRLIQDKMAKKRGTSRTTSPVNQARNQERAIARLAEIFKNSVKAPVSIF